MRSKRKLLLTAAFTALLGVGAFAGFSLTKDADKPAEVEAAGTNTTVYYAVSSSTVGNYTVKLNVNYKGDGSDWHQFNMTKVTGTYNGLDIYSCSYTDAYNGVGVMQFQLYNGSSHVSQQQPISSWTAVSNYNGKMYVHDHTWVTKRTDSNYTVYMIGYWSDLYIHVWNDYDLDTWPGVHVGYRDTNLVFNGYKLASYNLTVPSDTKFKFNDNGSNETETLTVTNGAYVYHNGSAWVKDTGALSSAAAFVWDLNIARLAVPSSGSIKEYSICGLDAKTWVDRYDGLASVSGAQAYVNAATMFTYKDQSSSGADTTITFAEVISQLRKSAYPNSTRIALFGNLTSESSISMIIIISISAVCLAAVGGYFLFRKKKEN